MFEQIFDRSNIKTIMTLMKYSLGASVPWVLQNNGNFQNQDVKTAKMMKELRHIGLDHADDDTQKRFFQGNILEYLKGWRSVLTQ